MVHERASSHSSASAASSRALPPAAEALSVFCGVTIKQEKITPPSSPTLRSTTLNGTYITPVVGDDKSQIGPIKSSTEILGELFLAFDAQVPVGLDKAASSAKKKHKKEKKSKKSSRHKERHHHGEDGESSVDNPSSDKRKLRHAEKARKRSAEANKSLLAEIDDDDPLTAKLLERKRRFESDNGCVQGISKIIIKTEKPSTSVSNKILPAKIVFKNLKDSEILRHTTASSSTSSSHRNHRNRNAGQSKNNDNLSDVSLSDEETYMREKSTFYQSADRPTNPFYANQSKVHDDEPMYINKNTHHC